MRIIIFLVSLFIVNACSIEGSFGGLISEIKDLESHNPAIILKDKGKCQYDNSEIGVVLVKGDELRKCIVGKKDVIFYLWSPNCNSKLCIPLELVQEQCDDIGVELYVIAEYFDWKKMKLPYEITNTILGIDVYHYKTKISKYYLKRFFGDLGMKNFDRKQGRFMYFKNGDFIQAAFELDSIKLRT